MSEVRVRFAPSPTGYLHVGGARTALFNWLLARRQGGVFILRIEDTDLERSTEEMVEGILDGLRWLGLNWDEGPYRQSERLERYREAAQQLLQGGHAYPCFCTPEELKARRAAAEASGRPWMYDGVCRRLSQVEREKKLQAGQPHALRFCVPEGGATRFADQVLGGIEVEHSSLDDFVLLRADGHPTYHLSVVVDDQDMRITHVVRGADHISNTFKQLLLYGALGAEAPAFAHLPLILGADRTRLSKRHGATSVSAYRDQGVLPEAMVNYLALLGWGHPEQKEMLGIEEMIEAFSLERVSKSNAVFDPEKLAWMSSQHLRALPLENLLSRAGEELKAHGLWNPEYAQSRRDWLRAVLRLLQPRMRTFGDLSTSSRAFFTEEFSYDPQAVKKFWKEPSLGTLLAELAAMLSGVEPFDAPRAEKCLRALAENKGLKAGLLINSSRVALTGQAVAPSLFEVMEVLGRDRVVSRIRRAAEFLAARASAADEKSSPIS